MHTVIVDKISNFKTSNCSDISYYVISHVEHLLHESYKNSLPFVKRNLITHIHVIYISKK